MLPFSAAFLAKGGSRILHEISALKLEHGQLLCTAVRPVEVTIV